MERETEAREATFLQASSQACGNEGRELLWNVSQYSWRGAKPHLAPCCWEPGADY